MRLLLLSPSNDHTTGLGRYARGVVRAARRELGDDAVFCPDPAPLRSRPARSRWARPRMPLSVAVASDARRLRDLAAQADVVHALNEALGPLAQRLAAGAGTPYVVTAHGTYADLDTYRPWARRWYRDAFARAAMVVAVSTNTAGVVRSRLPDATLTVVPGGFTPPKVPVLARRERPHRILAVGGLMRRKGFHTLIAAVAELRRRGSDVVCEIVGGSPAHGLYRRRLRRQIARLELSTAITLAGRVTDDELEARYSAADLFVLPSEHHGTRFEGLGLVYLEALARGLPVIACRDSGAEDIVVPDRNGLLVDPGDVEGLADAIARCFGDADLLARMGDAAPASVAGFSAAVVGPRLIDVYRDVLGVPFEQVGDGL